ncbi:MAG TPA: hypothetical protein VHV53_04050 [Solirubrobacterales bacterium]|nr:hypothetical protein [Solirubrobacterales bacterium]
MSFDQFAAEPANQCNEDVEMIAEHRELFLIAGLVLAVGVVLLVLCLMCHFQIHCHAHCGA